MKNRIKTYRVFEYNSKNKHDLTPFVMRIHLLLEEMNFWVFRKTIDVKGNVTASPDTLQLVIHETYGRGDYIAIMAPKNSTANLYEFHKIHIDSIEDDCTCTPIKWEDRHDYVAMIFKLYFYELETNFTRFFSKPDAKSRFEKFREIIDEWFDKNFQVSTQRTCEGLAMLLLASEHIKPTFNLWEDIHTEYCIEWIKSGLPDLEVTDQLIRKHLLPKSVAEYYSAKAKAFIANEEAESLNKLQPRKRGRPFSPEAQIAFDILEKNPTMFKQELIEYLMENHDLSETDARQAFATATRNRRRNK